MKNNSKNFSSILSSWDNALLAFVCFLMFLKRALLIKFEINYEEGKEIECALNIIEGKLAFRDFHWQYGPAGVYLVALLFKVLGFVNLLIPRIMVSLFAVATTYYSYRTARLYLNSKWSFWAALMASSGLVAREHTYGHGLAYLGMIGSFYYLVVFFQDRKRSRLLISGGFVFLALAAKPFVFGIGALIAAVFCLIWWEILVCRSSTFWKVVKIFLLTGFVPGAILYGYLITETSLDRMFRELVPMASGTYNMGGGAFFKPLFPVLSLSSFQDWIPQINRYLVSNLRWWIIVLTFVGGIVYLLRSKVNWGKAPKQYALLFFLLIYLLLIESETLILVSRPISFYINMLPCYILLAMTFRWLIDRGWVRFVRTTAILFAALYFFYPPLRLGIYHFQNSKALNFPVADTIFVPPYTWEGYHNIVSYVRESAPTDKPLLFAGYDSFVYLFSEREFYFPEDFTAFVKASFHPYNRHYAELSVDFYREIEEKIVEKIYKDPPGMILVPSGGLSEKNYSSSIFLKYLQKNWRLDKTLNRKNIIGPFDKINLQVDVYLPKS
tara:strand:- start:3294 stop:4955 length:1662 start_codon:yes stop_codon:yes gene_type:complete